MNKELEEIFFHHQKEIAADRYFITDTGLFLVFHQLWKTLWKSGKPLYKRYISWYPNIRKVIMWKNYPR